MTKQTSIQQITSLLDKPGALSEADQNSIASFRQSFPYFVPVRYMEALASHKKNAYSPAMLSAVRPYMADWIMFCSFLEAGGGNISAAKFEQKAAATTGQKEAPKVLSSEPAKQQVSDAAPQPPQSDNANVKEVIKEPISDAAAPVKNEQAAVKENAATESMPVTKGNEAVKETIAKDEQPKAANEAKSPITKEMPPVVDTESTDEKINQPVPVSGREEDSDDPFAELMGGNAAETLAAEEAVLHAGNKGVVHEIEENINKRSAHWITDEETSAQQAQTATPEIKEEVKEQSADKHRVHANAPIEQNAVAESVDELMSLDDLGKPGTGGIAETRKDEKPLISPVYTEDYFLQQGIKVSAEIPEMIDEFKTIHDEDKSLMVMMSFTEWLLHFKNTSEKLKEENRDQRALKSMWQKEKLAAAMEEENEEIPENVFEMAVNSITKEDGLASESLAEIYIKQEKYDKAIDMYRKLSLRNPQKNAYFARKIEEILKEKLS